VFNHIEHSPSSSFLGVRMLANGIYDLRYSAAQDSTSDAGSGLALLRDGKILGSDPWGGVFVGSCEFDAAACISTVRLRFEIPPEGKLITGFNAGPAGAVIDIVGAIADGAPAATTVVEVAGAPVNVELTYLGPLPKERAGRRSPAKMHP
jgi:hypothetical protein